MESPELLKPYEDAVDKLETLRTGRQVIVDKVLEAVKAELEEIDSLIADAEKELESAIEVIKEKTLEVGETQEGEKFMAVFVSGATRWDTSKLEGYALAHPELMALKSIGEPRVTFRKITRKE